MRYKSENIILTKSFAFAVKIVRLYKMLNEKNNEYILNKQLLRCGTSIGANVRGAHNAESKNDFIHKMGTAQKETGEAIYWPGLLKETGYLNQKEFDSIVTDANEFLKIIRSIILTSTNKQKIINQK